MGFDALVADPVTVGTLTGALALILFAAAWHKLSGRDAFLGALAAYRLLPEASLPAVARLLPAAEALLGIGMLVPATRAAALVAVAALMLAYALAIGINLVRGRRDIDCGCGGDGQSLSWALVQRNVVLAGAALIASGPMLERRMDWIDALTLGFGVLCFYALYLAADELLRQSTRLSRQAGEQAS
jgi:hypothetical protein